LKTIKAKDMPALKHIDTKEYFENVSLKHPFLCKVFRRLFTGVLSLHRALKRFASIRKAVAKQGDDDLSFDSGLLGK